MHASPWFRRPADRLPVGAAIYAVFFIESSVLGQWIPRIPDVKRSLELGDAELGLALLCMPLGTLVALALSGRLIERLGLGAACRLFLPLWALLFLGPGLVDSFAGLCVTLAVAGMAIALIETAMNTEAARQETRLGTRLMSRCHGFWSLGSMVGALAGGALAHAGVGVQAHFLVAMPVLAVLGWLAARLLPREADAPATSVADPIDGPVDGAIDGAVGPMEGSMLRWPSRALLPLCAMPLGLMMLEGVFIDWSAVFVKEVLAGSALAIAFIYAAFSCVMAITRLCGDWLVMRIGDVLLVQLSAVCGIVGASLFALAPTTSVAFVGAALAGAGAAVVFPLAVSAAARRTDRPAADNVAALNMISFSAFLFAPPLIGFLSEAFSLRIAILALVPGIFVSLWLSRELAVGVQPVVALAGRHTP